MFMKEIQFIWAQKKEEWVSALRNISSDPHGEYKFSESPTQRENKGY